jgi:hypothetical protein
MFLILLIGATLIGFILVVISAKSESNSFLDRFSTKLSALLFLYLALGVFLTYDLQNISIDDRQRETTLKIVERSWMGVNKIICDYHSKCPQFCDSLYFDWQKKPLG